MILKHHLVALLLSWAADRGLARDDGSSFVRGERRQQEKLQAMEKKAAKRDKCVDGEPCTSPTCEKKQKEETCDVFLDPSTNPQGKSVSVPLLDADNPFCIKFNTPTDTIPADGFEPCPGHHDNIYVNPSGGESVPWPVGPAHADNSINPLSGDTYLHVRDGSGASLACGQGSEYTGDWSPFVNTKCNNLCFDVKLFYDGCHSNVPGCKKNSTSGGWYLEVFPKIILQGGAPDYFRAVFAAYDYMTDGDGDSPEWRRICAPLAPLNSTGDLPSNENGFWYMGAPNNILSGLPPVTGSPSPNSAWPTLLSDVTAIQLPVDFTGNPAERVGYDNICMEEGECFDHCAPEPLCYWQYEWECEHMKQYEWYSNFTDLVKPLDTFPKRFCVCKILNDCCPDLCKIAERQFMALLLNVGSGQLCLDCRVKDCKGDCVHSVQSIISTVDELLASSSRSDYDCSMALQYLTGINEDVILCDEGHDCDCPQTDECEYNKGICVEKADCTPSADGTVTCVEHFCMEHDGCTCKIKKNADCPTSDKCAANGGKCVKDCVPSDKVTCKKLCGQGGDGGHCMCEIIEDQDCKQVEKCIDNKGECVKEEDCMASNTVRCDDLCDKKAGCVCKRKRCDQTKSCEAKKGRCMKDCVAGVGQVCDPDLCNKDQLCDCLRPE